MTCYSAREPSDLFEGLKNLLGIERLLGVYESASLPPHVAAQVEAIKEEIDYENTLADMRSMITDCHNGAERIRDVVQNLRTFSSLDEGRETVRPTDFLAADLARAPRPHLRDPLRECR